MNTFVAVVCLVLLATAPFSQGQGQLSKLTAAVNACGTEQQLSPAVIKKITAAIGKHLSQMKEGKPISVRVLPVYVAVANNSQSPAKSAFSIRMIGFEAYPADLDL